MCGVVVLGCAGEDATGPSLQRLEIRLIPTTATLMVNDTVQGTVVGFDQAGHTYPAGPVSWHSTDPTAVQIDTSGIVTALRPGSATLVATVGDVVDSLAIPSPARATGGRSARARCGPWRARPTR